MKTRSGWLIGTLLVIASALALNAGRSMTAALEVSPNPARPGERLAVTSSLTNNSNDLETVTVSVEMRGPCGMAASKGYKVLLNPHASDTSKAAFQAPACPGGYAAVLTVSDDRDGVLLSKATKNFEVIARNTVADAK